MEKTQNPFLFITFVGEKTIIKREEKYSLVALDDSGTCLIPNVFIRRSKSGDVYIALPKNFKTEYRLTDYNRETKERKLIVQKEVTAWDLKKLLKKTNDNVKKLKENLPF